MVPLIPDGIYAQIESRLKRRWEPDRDMDRLTEARARAMYPAGMSTDTENLKKSKGNSTENKLMKVLEAGEHVREREQWEAVFRSVDRTFPEDTPEGEVINMLYREGMTQAQVCMELELDRQTVRRRKDSYICHAAITAASVGLIGGQDD